MRTASLLWIEGAFAEVVGLEAIEELRQKRAKEWDSFSDAAELPDGYPFGVEFLIASSTSTPVASKAMWADPCRRSLNSWPRFRYTAL